VSAPPVRRPTGRRNRFGFALPGELPLRLRKAGARTSAQLVGNFLNRRKDLRRILPAKDFLPVKAPRHRTKRDPCFSRYTKVTGVADEYRPPELHYRQRDLKAIEPFDIALTFEKFPHEHWPVVSHRFYGFCQTNKLKFDWIPVRVDAD
jgi:hypothetical protein